MRVDTHTHTHTHTHTYIHALLFLFVVSSHLVFLASTVFISLFPPFYPLDCKEEIGGVGKRKRRGLKHGRPFFFVFLSLSPSQPSPGRLVRCVAKPVNKREFDAEGDTLHSITAVSVCDGSQCCLLFSYFSFLSVFLPTCVVPLACFA